MSTTDIRIRYPENTESQIRFAIGIKNLIHEAGCNPPNVCDMPSHVIITIATADLLDVATVLQKAKLL
jgi:hypothetical protein